MRIDVIQPSLAEDTRAPTGHGARSPLVIVYYWGSLMGSSNGSKVRALALLAFVCEHFDNVALYTYSNHPTDPWTDEQVAEFASRFPGVRLVADKEGLALRIAARLKKLVALVVPRAARTVFSLSLPALTPNHDQLHREADHVVYIVNYVDSMAQLNGFHGAEVVVETHDLRYFRRAKGTNASLVSLRNLVGLRYETALIAAAEAIVAITRNEAYFYTNMLPGAQVYYVPDYQPMEPVGARKEPVFQYDLLFAASGNELNVHALRRLFETMGERLRPFRIALCGSICERREIEDLVAAYPCIAVLGFLSTDELRDVYARSKACLSPADGTGLSIKLVEALRHRRPVFASAAARAALTVGHDDCVFPLDPDLMATLLSDPARIQAASDAAARFYLRFVNDGELDALRQTLARMSTSTDATGARAARLEEATA